MIDSFVCGLRVDKQPSSPRTSFSSTRARAQLGSKPSKIWSCLVSCLWGW